MKRSLTAFFILFIILTTSTVLAETENTDSTTATPTRKPLQILRQEKKDAVKERVQEKKETRAQSKEDRALKREEFKTKLGELKDARKKAIVEKIDERLGTINTKQTQRMSEVLTKLTGILDRLDSKVGSASATGKNTASASAAIAAARTAVATAQAKVDEQKAKDYTPTITDDENLKANVGETIAQMRQDLQAVHQLVVDAKQAVLKAAQATRLLQVGKKD